MVSLVIKVPQGKASCPVVLPIATGPISMVTLSFLFQWQLGPLFKEMDNVFLDCPGPNGPYDFWEQNWVSFVLLAT